MPMPKRSSVDDFFAQLNDVQRPHLEALRELPTKLLKTLMQARVQEYAATGAGWNDR
jgi:hypothetical protein